MDDTDDPTEDRPPAAAPLSKTSSWVTLGFLLGAATVWAYLSHQEKVTPAVPATPTEWPARKPLERAPLTHIEAIFFSYQEHAVWDRNLTEVAMWRSDTRSFSEYYEVRRVGEDFYFRSIPRISPNRRLIGRKPLPDEVPLKFTETEAQYMEWFEHGRFERSEDATLQPTLLGPALIPAGETVPRPKGSKAKVEPAPAPPPPDLEKLKVEIKPNP